MGRKNKKKNKKPYEYTLFRLRKLLKITHFANPKIYAQIKGESNKKQVDFLKKLLSEKGVPFDNLSEKRFKEIKNEYDLKREMAELGINGDHNNDDDGIALSARRPRRNTKKVSYKLPEIPKYDEEDSQNEEGNDDKEKQEQEQSEEESEEQYVPSDYDEDEDEDEDLMNDQDDENDDD